MLLDSTAYPVVHRMSENVYVQEIVTPYTYALLTSVAYPVVDRTSENIYLSIFQHPYIRATH